MRKSLRLHGRAARAAWKFATISIVSGLVTAGAAPGGAPAGRAETGEGSGWITLFDGKTLHGWRNPYDWGKAWVENGEIHLQASRKFFLCTTRPFRDFEFEAEVRLPTRGHANSGFMFRCHAKHNRVYGYQAEVDPSARAWSGGLYDEGRRGWIWPHRPNNSTAAQEFRARTRGAFHAGAWNHYRIRCRGDHIQIFLNGIACTDLHDSKDAAGYLALQHHGERGQVYRFRNIRVRLLPPPGPIPSVSAAADLLEAPPARMRPTDGMACPAGGIQLLGPGSETLRAWRSRKGGTAAIPWKFQHGVLQAVPDSGDIETRRTFANFRLHLEFKVNSGRHPGQDNGNSGVYLQKRYEVQILNSFGMPNLRNDECGALYRFKAPDANACRPHGRWQTYDIEFRAPKWSPAGKKLANARISVFQNGIRIQDRVELTRKTGAGEAEGPAPGPILLQEHGNPVQFRNIWILPR